MAKKPKYINNDPRQGLVYDYRMLNDRYRSLGCPDDVYDPSTIPWDSVQYAVLLSERAIGKTTNILLYGMIMAWEYGTVIHYVRQRENDIMPKRTKALFDVITDPAYGYVEKITHGEYNAVFYRSRRWYWAKYDSDGTLEKISDEHFCFMCSLQEQESLKSGYNCPTGDLLLFDEFISRYYYPNEFLDLCNLISTVFRSRRSPKVIMSANTINRHSPYYNDLEIYDDIQVMQIGERRQIKTPLGTSLHVELIGATAERAKKRNIINKLFFGFRNPSLASITGEDWSMKNYQHIPYMTDEEKKELVPVIRNLYISFNKKLIRLDVNTHPTLGACVFIHWANRTYEDSIILTTEDRLDPRYQFGFGHGTLKQFLSKMLQQNRLYFASNDVGSFFTAYYGYVAKYSPI